MTLCYLIIFRALRTLLGFYQAWSWLLLLLQSLWGYLGWPESPSVTPGPGLWDPSRQLCTFSPPWLSHPQGNLRVQICPCKIYLYLPRKKGEGGGGKRVTFNDQFAVFSSPLQKQIRICTFTVSLPQRREMFSSINIWSGLSHLENLVEEEINFKSLDLLLVSGEPYWTQKRDFPGKLREH